MTKLALAFAAFIVVDLVMVTMASVAIHHGKIEWPDHDQLASAVNWAKDKASGERKWASLLKRTSAMRG